VWKLTPWSRVLLEKLTVTQLVKKFPAFHRRQRFITVFTTVRHWSLSWARWIPSTPPHPISLRSLLTLSPHLRIGLPSRFPYQNVVCISHLSHAYYMPLPSHPPSKRTVFDCISVLCLPVAGNPPRGQDSDRYLPHRPLQGWQLMAWRLGCSYQGIKGF